MTAQPFDLDALLARHPLPWTVESGDPDFGTYIRDSRAGLVATWLEDDPARLLAAAPAMMKAIHEAVELVATDGKPPHDEACSVTDEDRRTCDCWSDGLLESLP